jgi:hypothetical protein
MAINQSKSVPSKEYINNFDRIFGTKEERAAKHAKEKAEQAEKVEAMKKATSAAFIGGNFEPFKSPVDGSIIKNPAQLRSHNSKHGVADIREYGDEWFAGRGREMYSEKTGCTSEAKRERQQICHDVLKYYKMIR